MRIVYYYQTFDGLDSLLKNPQCTHIHVSSIHFGVEEKGKTPYIHLNDNHPDDPCFDDMWKQVREAAHMGIKIVLMIGGAGGAFQELFQDFHTYYGLLRDTLHNHPYISGVDLDVEEEVDMVKIQMLIDQIDHDFPDFTISMAPVAYALVGDQPGMGGFVYKDLLKTRQGQRIDYFNGQFYGEYTTKIYEQVVNNGFPPHKVVMGMTSGQFSKDNEKQVLDTLTYLQLKYPDFGGVFDWEYFNAYPSPNRWSVLMNSTQPSLSLDPWSVCEYLTCGIGRFMAQWM